VGDIFLHLANYKKAAQSYEKGLMAAGDHFVRLENMYRLGFCQIKQGDESGYRHFEEALETSKASSLGAIMLLSQVLEMDILIEKGEIKKFDKTAAQFREEVTKRVGKDNAYYTIERLRARHLLNQGKPEEALSLLNKVIPWYQKSNFIWLELECLTLQAQALEKSGQDNGLPRARILEILDTLEGNLDAAPILREWQEFWKKYEWVV
jgi:tetratricopeptide (TPR) repeat protein